MTSEPWLQNLVSDAFMLWVAQLAQHVVLGYKLTEEKKTKCRQLITRLVTRLVTGLVTPESCSRVLVSSHAESNRLLMT